MPDTQIIDATSEAEDRHATARRARHDAQRVVWRETNLRSGKEYVDAKGKTRTSSRLAFCGRSVSAGVEGVGVKLTTGPDGARAGFSGLQTCGSVWACPCCSEKINAGRQAELTQGLDAWVAGGGAVLFGTVTVQHSRRDRLADLWDAVSPAFNRMTSGAGVAWNGSKRRGGELGDKATFGIAGYVRLVEVKVGNKGWHPHVHFLLFLDKEISDALVDQLRHRLFGRWSKALGKEGFRSMEFDKDGHAVGVDLRKVKDAEYIADYFAKNDYRPANTSSTRAAAYEVTGSHSKKAGKGGRTPFELLADLVAKYPVLQRDQGTDLLVDPATGEIAPELTLWHEWERASQGRRQLTWSRGMRKLLGLDVELTDEELAEQELAGDVVLVITRDEWKAGHWPMRRVELLEHAEAGTLPEFFSAWLASRWEADDPSS